MAIRFSASVTLSTLTTSSSGALRTRLWSRGREGRGPRQFRVGSRVMTPSEKAEHTLSGVLPFVVVLLVKANEVQPVWVPFSRRLVLGSSRPKTGPIAAQGFVDTGCSHPGTLRQRRKLVEQGASGPSSWRELSGLSVSHPGSPSSDRCGDERGDGLSHLSFGQ